MWDERSIDGKCISPPIPSNDPFSWNEYSCSSSSSCEEEDDDDGDDDDDDNDEEEEEACGCVVQWICFMIDFDYLM